MGEKNADRATPSKIGRYQVLDRLAAGGMAEVYRARSASDGNRLIAIKCMLPALVDDEEFANMFVDEAKLASQLSHPNIVQIFELGRYKEQLYIAMELIHGRDLRAIVRKAKKRGQALSPQFVAYVVAKTADALDYALRNTSIDGKPLKLVHRDISPQNILVGYDGNVKVVDFGIAKADFRRTMSRVGILKGKFAYMAPEQVKTGEVDGRTDIFALGAVLYEAFAHRKLFFGESDFSILERVTNGTLPDDVAAWDRLPADVANVVRRAVTVDPTDRFQEASHMAEALEPLLIDGRTIYGPKQARELMTGLFTQEIEDNELALRAFASTAGEMSGILRRPSQKVEKLDKVEVEVEEEEETPGRDWSIVTADPAKAAEEVEQEIQRDRDSRSTRGRGRDESNTSTDHIHNTSTRPEPERRPSGRHRDVSEDDATRVTGVEPMPMEKVKSSTRGRSPSQTIVPVTETRGIPLVGAVLGGSPEEQRRRLLWTLTAAIGVVLVLLVIVLVKRATPTSTEVLPDEDALADIAERPRIPRVTTTPLDQPQQAPQPSAPDPVERKPEKTEAVASPASPSPASEAAEPQYGYLSVRTSDGRPATVFIDKKEVGPAPIVKRKMPYGEHIVRVVDKANRAKVLQVILTSKHRKTPVELEVSP